MLRFRSYVLLFCLILTGTAMPAQGYLKLLEQPERSFDRKLLHLSNGDIITGDASQKGLILENERGIYMTRIDRCGNLVWKKRFVWKQNVIEFKDFVRNEADDIFILGRAFESPSEYTFLMKINKDGKLIQVRFFQGGTIDQFTFDIDRHQGKLLVTGLLLNWMVHKEGFAAVFDESLNYVSGTKIKPFESDGASLLGSNTIICRSGPLLLQIDGQSTINWSVKLENVQGAFPVFGPLDTGDGYLFELHRDGYAFFYKIDDDGNLVWQSELFPSTKYGADVVLRADGSFLAFYNEQGTGETALCRMELSANGKILSQYRLAGDKRFINSTLDVSIYQNRTINIVANSDLFAGNATGNIGFLMQVPADSLNDQCFSWEPFSHVKPVDSILVVAPFEMELLPLIITQQNPDFNVVNAENTFSEQCDLQPVRLVEYDTILPCGVNWEVSLPDYSTHWDDGFYSSTRTLTAPGTYRASNTDCIYPVTYSWNFSREVCPCAVFLPNVFSPDDDGFNDRLELYSECTLESVRIQVFNRWGEIVAEIRDPNGYWDGQSKNRALPPDVYMVQVIYSRVDESGQVQTHHFAQDVTLVR